VGIFDFIKGNTKIAAVIGDPIEHSISPQLHNTLSWQLGINMAYIPLRVDKAYLGKALETFKALGFIGINVTVPHKQHVIEYLDEVTEDAKLAGAVNTIEFRDGKLTGYNTDISGFVRMFKSEAGTGFRERDVVILGAGGAARGVCIGIIRDGAKRISIANRTLSRAEQLAEELNNLKKGSASACLLNSREMKKAIQHADIIINTTSVGMYPHTECNPLDEDIVFRENQIVCDLIYNPFETCLLKSARLSGCLTINGLGMLIYQGVHSFEIWNKVEVPETVVKNVLASFKNYFKIKEIQ